MSSYTPPSKYGRRLVIVVLAFGGVLLITMAGHTATTQLACGMGSGARSSSTFGSIASAQHAGCGRETSTGATSSLFTYHRPVLISTGRKSTLRANLNPANRYLVAFTFSGFTNQVMDLINQLHTARLANHIPILPPVIGHMIHLHGYTPLMPVREFFDLSALEKTLGMPILELMDLKALRDTRVALDVGEELPQDESIPCWGVMQTQSQNDILNNNIRSVTWDFHLDLLRTPVPVELYRGYDALYEPIARFIQPPMAESYLSPPSKKMLDQLHRWNEPLPPMLPQPHSDPLTCLDGLYYMASENTTHGTQDEYLRASYVWTQVGVHMKFTDEWEQRTREVERRILGLSPADEIPLFHAMHIRHGDRLPERCSDPKTARTDRECRPVSDFVTAMNENLRELLRAGKLGWQGTEKVLVLSDDTSEHFKAEVAEHGYIFVDHDELKTFDVLGPWFVDSADASSQGSTVIDSILMTHARSFVGSDGSTMSILGGRRGADWYGNVFRLA